jgi:hypothetical protein
MANDTFGLGAVGRRAPKDTAGKHTVGITALMADGYSNLGIGIQKSIARIAQMAGGGARRRTKS